MNLYGLSMFFCGHFDGLSHREQLLFARLNNSLKPHAATIQQGVSRAGFLLEADSEYFILRKNREPPGK